MRIFVMNFATGSGVNSGVMLTPVEESGGYSVHAMLKFCEKS